jgi:arginase family enzyme
MGLLRHLFQTKTVVAMDVVELAPIGNQPASDFLTAKLIYKCLGYLQEGQAKR